MSESDKVERTIIFGSTSEFEERQEQSYIPDGPHIYKKEPPFEKC